MKTLRNRHITFLVFLISVAPFAQSQIQVNRDVLNFGAGPRAHTPSQTFFIDTGGDGTLDWSISPNEDWVTVAPMAGIGSCNVHVSVNPEGMGPGSHTSDIVVTNQDDPLDNGHVTVALQVYESTQPPFGAIDTPADGAAVSGATMISGWVLDDIGIKSVTVFIETEGASPIVTQAQLIEGARPDIEAVYPGIPMNYRASWQCAAYFSEDVPMLTIRAVARDEEDLHAEYEATVVRTNIGYFLTTGIRGVRRIMERGVAFGNSCRISGYALSPQPNQLTTIDVYVDGLYQGNAVHSVYRQDLAALFPGYANSNSAGAYFDLNTTNFSNGVHSIEWRATDDAGHTSSSGSQYFTIQNPDMPEPVLHPTNINFAADLEGNHSPPQSVEIRNGGGGILNWQIRGTDEIPWLAMGALSGSGEGSFEVSVQPDAMDPGYYEKTVRVQSDQGTFSEFTVSLWKTDMSEPNFAPFGEFDTPSDGSTVSGSIAVTGWALDELGVESVKIYSRTGAGSSAYIGDGVFVEGARPDISNTKTGTAGNTRAGWGCMLLTNHLPGGGQGTYDLEARATNIAGREVSLGTKTIHVDNENSVKPFGAIDSPGWGGVVSGSTGKIRGWVVTRNPNTIPADGSTIRVKIDGNVIDAEVTSDWEKFSFNPNNEFHAPDYCSPVGWEAELSNMFLGLTHSSFSYEASSVLDEQNKMMTSEPETMVISQLFVIDNEGSPASLIEEQPGSTGPDRFALSPVFPNPFNPVANIMYHLNDPGRVNLTIYNLLGRQVKSLLSEKQAGAGQYKIKWFGLDDSGAEMPSGIYILKMQIGSRIQTQKMLLIR